MTSLNDLVMELHIFHQNILNIYNSKDTDTEKWTKIATYMHDKNEIVTKTFVVIKKNEAREEINMDYTIDFDKLQTMISQESDQVRKTSFIILSLHTMIYQLMTSEGNYRFNLHGKEEMNVLKEDIEYYINMSVKNESNIYFHAFILLYALESLFNRHFYIGVDFEYTAKKIQLAQLNFEHSTDTTSIIMMVSPSELEPIMMNNFIKLIMCNKIIKKILHGSDSLDIPYVYDVMLESDGNKIIKFTQGMIDTKILCEYYKLNRDGTSDNKCSIYDQDPLRSAVYYFNVISEEQQNKLSELLEAMPAPHDITWNIHKMPKSQELYAQYDVIFLKYFYYRMIFVATEDESTDAGKKSIIDLYKHVLTELTQFVYLENNNVTLLRNKCKSEVDVVNNYFIKKLSGSVKLIDIYQKASTDLSTTNPAVEIDKILKIGHIRNTIIIVMKRIIYGHASRYCKVYKDKATLWIDKLHNKFIIEFFEVMQFHYLASMFNELDKILEVKVKAICNEQ